MQVSGFTFKLISVTLMVALSALIARADIPVLQLVYSLQ